MNASALVARLPRDRSPRAFRPPRKLYLARPDDREALERLLVEGLIESASDTMTEQLEELVRVREPRRKLGADEVAEAVLRALSGRPLEEHGAWVHYPWSRRLVHVLPEVEYRELRTARNRHKITSDEQAMLGAATIGIVGLSVGRAAAVTLALEGVGGRLRLADPDTLSLSNLNRLCARAGDLGQNKAVLAAEEVLEIDPYLEVEVLAEGVTAANLDAFVRGLDLLVEECDDLSMKLLLREEARRAGVPVLMDTSDRGLVDVERYDLDPGYPLLHGLTGGLGAADVAALGGDARLELLLRMVASDDLSARAGASLLERGETVDTWPQLASGVALGGALVTDTARRILLGTFTASGRYYVDIEELIAPDAARVTPAMKAPSAPERVAHVPFRRQIARTPSDDHVREIVRLGMLAPSAHNTQPWRFVFRGGSLECHVDPSRTLDALDPGGEASVLAIGCAVENMVLGAEALGLASEVTRALRRTEGSALCTLRFRPRPGGAPDKAISDPIERRATNRHPGTGQPLSAEAHARLARAAEEAGARLLVLADSAGKEAVAEAAGEADRVTFLHPKTHKELFGGFRWTSNEVATQRDGLDVATLELSPAKLQLLKLVARADVAEALRATSGGSSLRAIAREPMRAASALAVVTVPRSGDGLDAFGAGRALERVWLEATRLGVGVHPMATLPILRAVLGRGGAAFFSDDERERGRTACEAYASAFAIPEEALDAALLLLHDAARTGPETPRSIRRFLRDVLFFE